MNTSLLYAIIILIIVAIINSIIAPKVHEHFYTDTQEDEVPLKSINLCGRNIVFPYFARNDFTASQRSIQDNTIVKTLPGGICRVDAINGLHNSSHSIVHENSLFYNLKNSCLGFIIKRYSFNAGKLTLTLSRQSPEDINNLLNLFLLNPLYIEFSINGDSTSFGYAMPVWPDQFTFNNKSDKTDYKLVLTSITNVVKNIDNSTCDKAFNYKDFSKNQRAITNKDLDIIVKHGVINMKAYYLDNLSSSFQNIGRFIKVNQQSNSGEFKIFEKDYQKYYQDSFSTQTYEFMNNIALLYSNYVTPIFTINFSINLLKNTFNMNGNKYMISKIYMDNSIGQYKVCEEVRDNIGVNNNNILAMAVEGNDANTYNAHFFTGTEGNCSFGAPNMITIQLPYLLSNNLIDISITVSPTEKVVMASWRDIINNSTNKQVVFAKKQECTTSEDYNVCYADKEKTTIVNSMIDLFMKKSDLRQPLSNIIMKYNTDVIKKIDSCHLGYINLLSKFNQ